SQVEYPHARTGSDIQDAAVRQYGLREAYGGRSSGTTIAGVSTEPDSRNGCYSARRINLAYVVVRIGNIEIAAAIHGHAIRTSDLGCCGWPTVSAVSKGVVSRNCVNDSGGIDEANDVVAGIGEI